MKKSGACIIKRNPQTVKGRGIAEDEISFRFGKDLTNLYKANPAKNLNKKQAGKTCLPAARKQAKTTVQKKTINSKVVASKAGKKRQESYKAGLHPVDRQNLQIPALASVVQQEIVEYLIQSEVRRRLTDRNSRGTDTGSRSSGLAEKQRF
jgi:hypothetical protein